MCGIVGIFNIQEQTPELRQKALRMSQKIRHRGPDWSGIYTGPTAILCHERLSIVDPESGRQPLFAPDKKQVLAVNGEIYNHKDIRATTKEYQYQTGSDCEVILALYREWKSGNRQASPVSLLEKLSGIFAFALYDVEDGSFFVARDPIGVIPLYIGYDRDGKVYVASELKALEGHATVTSSSSPVITIGARRPTRACSAGIHARGWKARPVPRVRCPMVRRWRRFARASWEP